MIYVVDSNIRMSPFGEKMARYATSIRVIRFCQPYPSSISVYPEQLVLWRWILMLNLLIYEFEFSSNIINSKWVTDRFRWLWVLIRDLQLAWINWFLKIHHLPIDNAQSDDQEFPNNDFLFMTIASVPYPVFRFWGKGFVIFSPFLPAFSQQTTWTAE